MFLCTRPAPHTQPPGTPVLTDAQLDEIARRVCARRPLGEAPVEVNDVSALTRLARVLRVDRLLHPHGQLFASR